ncbi:hypothetical protein GCM10011611_35860 [Aliidongia dinghuensis]|uniref:Uncharacterized protein n=1 Tax=Aliidongia dinghuensis TaxID=1867774 RepID=A0A8J3E640_9PROT|nr:hypothetical protein [Aliidongia dinghuensis]GGF26640.1 hypothetical protein GCM10011611_35860 [Aliidongia dinghuensis]
MYDSSDPRSTLASAADRPAPTQFAGAECGKFYETAPQEDDANGRTWFIRSQNCVVAYTEARDGAHFVRSAQPDEYVLLLPEAGVSAEILTPDGRIAVAGYSIAFVPPGASEIRISGAGPVVRLLTARAEDLAAKCVNAAAYRTPQPNIAPFAPWPDAAAGRRVHAYSLDVPDEPGRFGRIWRGSTLMVNFLPPQSGPRDVTKLSPHHHDDFEQISLALEGAFTHHLRWPWTTNLNNWRDDLHEYCAAPSAMVIPPPAIHTSRGMLEGINQLVDIFCPPRRDFSLKPGWVLNHTDYPMPSESSNAAA